MPMKAVRIAGCTAILAILVMLSGSRTASSSPQNWADLAVHNFGAPINTMWDEGELSFADDGTMVFWRVARALVVTFGFPICHAG